MKLLEALATGLFQQEQRSKAFKWCHALCERDTTGKNLSAFVKTCLQTSTPFSEAAAKLDPMFAVEGVADAQRTQLICLRGLLGYGVLIHCLSLRHRVNYGLNFRCANPIFTTHFCILCIFKWHLHKWAQACILKKAFLRNQTDNKLIGLASHSVRPSTCNHTNLCNSQILLVNSIPDNEIHRFTSLRCFFCEESFHPNTCILADNNFSRLRKKSIICVIVLLSSR